MVILTESRGISGTEQQVLDTKFTLIGYPHRTEGLRNQSTVLDTKFTLIGYPHRTEDLSDQSTGPIDTKFTLIGYPHRTEGLRNQSTGPDTKLTLICYPHRTEGSQGTNQQVLDTKSTLIGYPVILIEQMDLTDQSTGPRYKIHSHWLSGYPYRTDGSHGPINRPWIQNSLSLVILIEQKDLRDHLKGQFTKFTLIG